MSIQTIFQAGNSKVVSIPPQILSDLDISIGDKVEVEKVSDDTLTIKKHSATKPTRAKHDFQKWLTTFMSENGEALDELAER